MEIKINRSERYVDVWLLRGEDTPDLGAIRRRYPAYDVTLFRSGAGGLADLTADLLRCNSS